MEEWGALVAHNNRPPNEVIDSEGLGLDLVLRLNTTFKTTVPPVGAHDQKNKMKNFESSLHLFDTTNGVPLLSEEHRIILWISSSLVFRFPDISFVFSNNFYIKYRFFS